jgi:hypothetical protein
MSAALFFFVQDIVGYSGLLWLHTSFRTFFVCSVKNVIGILVGITLNLEITWYSIDILTILILQIQEQDMSFHLFACVLFDFFHQCFNFLLPWLNLLPGIFFYVL